jgi:N-acyl homoserine lactone hydrolase
MAGVSHLGRAAVPGRRGRRWTATGRPWSDATVTLAAQVHRIRLGTFVRPGSETRDGRARAEVVLGYLVRHPNGLLLLDTGIGAVDDETEAHYRPQRRELPAALAEQGARLADVDLVVNCHLHFDHCGGNRLLAGRPVVAQRRELELARQEGYTMPELVDFPQARYEPLDGEAELWPGVLVLSTPGHTEGHQSLAVRCQDGTVVLAGQAHDYASDLTADVLAADVLAADARASGGADPAGVVPQPSPWLERVLELDPRRVLFAHDQAVWEPG